MFKNLKTDFFKNLSEDADTIVKNDPAARSKIEVFLCYPGFHAVLFYRFSHFLWEKGFYTFARFVSSVARFLTGVDIHPGARIGRRLFIDHATGLVIGETTEIGDDVTLYHGVTLGGTSCERTKRHPTLKNRVIVGAGAQVLGPITIGDDARIGSNAVVLASVPPGATAVGVPAQIVKKRKKAEDVSFEAYAAEKTDPVLDAIEKLKTQVKKLEKEVAAKKGVDKSDENG